MEGCTLIPMSSRTVNSTSQMVTREYRIMDWGSRFDERPDSTYGL